MSKTVREIVTDAQELLGDVPGAGVQTYADDRMFRDCIRTFNLFHKKYPWDQFTSWSLVTLDGISGKIVDPVFQHLKDFEDIFSVFPENSNFEIPILDRRRNPNSLRGTSALFWTALPTIDPDYQWKRIQVIPPTTSGKIVISWRHYPRDYRADGTQTPWDWDDVMDLDEDMLIHAVAWMTLSSDDINAGAAQDQQNLADDRYQEITGNLARRKITPSKTGGGVPYNWYPTSPNP
jgi:hypothetical protein